MRSVSRQRSPAPMPWRSIKTSSSLQPLAISQRWKASAWTLSLLECDINKRGKTSPKMRAKLPTATSPSYCNGSFASTLLRYFAADFGKRLSAVLRPAQLVQDSNIFRNGSGAGLCWSSRRRAASGSGSRLAAHGIARKPARRVSTLLRRMLSSATNASPETIKLSVGSRQQADCRRNGSPKVPERRCLLSDLISTIQRGR